MTPFLSRQSISVHVRVMLVDITELAVGTPGLPVGAAKNKKCYHRLLASEHSERDTYRGKNEKIGDVCLLASERSERDSIRGG